MYTYKVMLCPNNKQKTKMKQIMNKCIECQNIIYNILDSYVTRDKRIPKCNEIRKLFTVLKKDLDNNTIEARKGMTNNEERLNHLDVLFYDVSNDALKQTIKDTYNAFMRYFNKESKYPNRKEYKTTHKSFYMDPYKIKFTDKKVKLEKIANNQKTNRDILNWINLAEHNRIPQNCKYYNPRVSFDGDRFWLTVSVDDEYRPVKKHKLENKPLEDTTIGIDLNIKSHVVSDGRVYTSVNRTPKVRKEIKKLKRLERQSSRQYLQAKKDKKELCECKNFIKTKKKINHQYKKITYLRENATNQIVNDLLSKPPKKIVVETLDVKQIQKNKQISSKIQMTCFRKVINSLKNRIRYTPILLVEANKYYPSSKKCSKCGSIKHDLTLKERTYCCPNCGFIINRDLNAAINLKNYSF